MKENFTAQQREIVARKMGYNGPMDMFDDYLASTPSDANKYSNITAKLAERMAKGGMVKKRRYAIGGVVDDTATGGGGGTSYSDQQIKDAIATSKAQGFTDAQIIQGAGTNFGVADRVTSLMGGSAPPAATTTYSDQQIKDAIAASKAQGFTDAQIVQGASANYGVAADRTNSLLGTGATSITGATGNDTVAGGGANPDQAYIDMYKNILGKAPDAEGLAYWKSKFGDSIDADELKTFTGTAKDLLNKNVANTYGVAADKMREVLGNSNTAYTDQQIKDAIAASRAAGFTDAQSAEGAASKFGVAKTRFDAIVASMGATPTPVTTDAAGKPLADVASSVTAAQITGTTGQNLSTTNYGAGTTASTIGTTGQATATAAAAPTTTTAASYKADTSAADTAAALAKVAAEKGTVSDKAQAAAVTQAPTTTVLKDVTAAQDLTKQQVVGAPTRTLGEAEKVAGSAVDQAAVEASLAKTTAAQGEVTEQMTVQGQLNKLMKDFDSGNPPPWAAANLRNVTAVLASRGLGASSLAGQAMIQATLESALPIASADAQAYQSVAAQNLSNRQQTAVLVAQQRAAFLGQEFDQNFQTRVVNAAKVSDVANMNFNATQQIALENARLTQTMDLANLSNKQAVVMANAAQMANLETTNLNNRQQVAVENAKAFLAMDMANLSNAQQTTMFKAQATTQAILSDTAASNASKQFNAASTQQAEQFNANLSTQVSQFNAAQSNAISQFNTDQTNAVSKFNAEVQNQRDQFNATQRLVIDQSNAQWQREISTANTAATNAANSLNAQLTQQMSIAEYNNETQMYRDAVTHAWTSSENDAQRATTLAAAEIDAAARMAAGQFTADAATSSSVGSFFTKLLLG
jgi:hypothetical protein